MNKLLLIAILIALLLAFALPGVALAQYGPEDKIVFGGSFTLKSGETLAADLIVFGGSVRLEQDSLVTGDVVVFGGRVDSFGTVAGSVVVIGGDLSINGLVEGSVLIVGGSVYLQEQAVIGSDVTSIGGSIQQDPGAQIRGEVVNGLQFPPGIPGVIEPPTLPSVELRTTPVWGGLWFIFRLFVWAALAALVTLFVPNPMNRVARTIVDQPVLSTGVGLLTAIVAPLFLVVMAITIILLPVSLLGALVLVIAWIFGRIALGMEIGRRIGAMFDRQWPYGLAAGVGTFVLALVVDGVGELIPCVGWLLPAFVGVLGVGAVLLTRFGTQTYPPYQSVGVFSSPRIPPVSPSPAEPPTSSEIMEEEESPPGPAS